MHQKRPETPIINMGKPKKWVGRSNDGPVRRGAWEVKFQNCKIPDFTKTMRCAPGRRD